MNGIGNIFRRQRSRPFVETRGALLIPFKANQRKFCLRQAGFDVGHNQQAVRNADRRVAGVCDWRSGLFAGCDTASQPRKLDGDPRPSVAFDSPYRVRKSLAIIAEVLPERQLTLTRELTKLHEQILRGTSSEVLEALDDQARGEFTLVISGGRSKD